MPAAPATKAAIQRAVDAVIATGLSVSAVRVEKNGTVIVETTGVDKDSENRKRGPKKWGAAS